MSFGWRLLILLVLLCIVYLWKSSQLIIAPKRFISPYNPADFGLKYENITLTTEDGINLKAWFIPCRPFPTSSETPDTPTHFYESFSGPTIIICHGYGADKGDCIGIARFLHYAGYNVLMFDFRGHGQSGGKYCSLGYYECEDLKTAIRGATSRGATSRGLKSNSIYRWSKASPLRAQARRVGAIGVSMGGTVAFMVAAETKELSAVVSDGAYLSFHSAVSSFAKCHFKAPKYPFIPPAVWASGLRLKFNPSELNLVKFMPKISPTPILIIHGSEDKEIHPRDANILFEKALEPKELWIVKGARHLESHYVAREDYEHKVITFFDRALKNKATDYQ